MTTAPPAFPLSIADVNALDVAGFVALFGDVAEHTPWVAEVAFAAAPFANRAALIAAFEVALAKAPRPDQLALVRAHPDLAGKAAQAGAIAEDSKKEQAGAGLDRLSAEEFARFTDLNGRYRERFRFPFILAVKGATKDIILASFAERVDNDPEAEFANALAQIARIFRFRLEDRVLP